MANPAEMPGDPMKMKPMGISPDPNGRLILRYLDNYGQRVELDLTDVIEQTADAAVRAHERKLHGHQI